MKSNNEIWKQIEDTTYFVSNYGRVKNKKGEILKPFEDKDGYNEYKLHINKKPIHKKEHRLVAQTFISNPNNLPQVNHKDGNKQNNYIDNLEWCTNQENQLHSCRVLKNRIKSINQYDLDGNFIKTWESGIIIEETLGYDRAHICSVCTGNRKSAYGYIWKHNNEVM